MQSCKKKCVLIMESLKFEITTFYQISENYG